MDLSNEQRELLSAYIDGEVSATDRALAEVLLKRPEATAYVAGMRKIAALAQNHGRARAPQGFAAMVSQALEGDFDSISQPTSMAPLHAMPAPSWRMPLMAMAAAVVMAIGLLAYNALVVPSTMPRTEGVARQTAPADAREGLEDSTAAPATAASERTRKSRGLEDYSKLKDDLAKEPSKSPDSSNDVPSGSSGGKENPQPAPAMKKPSQPGTGGGSGGESKNEDKGPTRRNGKSEVGRVTDGKPPESRPAEDSNWEHKKDAAQDEKEAGETGAASEVTLVVAPSRKGATSSVLTDVLQVGCMYGAASLVEDQGESEGVAIEIPEDQLEEVMAALEKLTREQGLGEIKDVDRGESEDRDGRGDEQKGPVIRGVLERAGTPKDGHPTAKTPSYARDYLPSELRGAIERDGNDSAEKENNHNSAPEAEKGEAAPPPPAPVTPKRMVRVVIRLK